MQLQQEINTTEKESNTSTNKSGIFRHKTKHERFYSVNGDDKSENTLQTRCVYFAASLRSRVADKYRSIYTNKYVLKILKFISPIITRIVIALIWFALIYSLAIPSPGGHGLGQESNHSNVNKTYQILNSTTINVSTINGEYDLTLIVPASSEHLSVVLQKNNTKLTALNYKLNNLPMNEQGTTGLLSDLSNDPYSVISLCLLVIFSSTLGYLFRLIRLPSLLGMLLAGIIYTHVTYNTISISPIPRSASSTLRSIALVIILSRGGLGISPTKLRARAFEILRLATIPCLGETVIVAVACYLIVGVAKEYWYWAAMAGCTVAAVSPAVVLPLMLHLQEKRYGTKRGIPTMIIAASSFDDVISISLFFVFLTLAYSTSELAITLIRGPLELLAGLVYGILIGIIGKYIARETRICKQKQVNVPSRSLFISYFWEQEDPDQRVWFGRSWCSGGRVFSSALLSLMEGR